MDGESPLIRSARSLRGSGGHRPAEVPVPGIHPQVGNRRRAHDRNTICGHRPQATPRPGCRGVEAGAREHSLCEVHKIADTFGVKRQIEAGELCGSDRANGPLHRYDARVEMIIDQRNARQYPPLAASQT